MYIPWQEFSIKTQENEKMRMHLLIYYMHFQEYIYNLERAETETPSDIILVLR